MIDLKSLEVWFITGSQHLYGEETLKQVAAHSEEIARNVSNETEIYVTRSVGVTMRARSINLYI